MIIAHLEGDPAALGALADLLEDQGDARSCYVRRGEWWLAYDKPARVRDIERLSSDGLTLAVRGWKTHDWWLGPSEAVHLRLVGGHFPHVEGAMAHVWWRAVALDEGCGRMLRDVERACLVTYNRFRLASGRYGPSHGKNFVGRSARDVWVDSGRGRVCVPSGSPWRVVNVVNWVGGPGPGSARHHCVLLDPEALEMRRGNIPTRRDARNLRCEMRHGDLEVWR